MEKVLGCSIAVSYTHLPVYPYTLSSNFFAYVKKSGQIDNLDWIEHQLVRIIDAVLYLYNNALCICNIKRITIMYYLLCNTYHTYNNGTLK